MMETVLQRIEKRLAELGISASGASHEAGLSRDAIRNMRRTSGDPSLKTLTALAPVLKTTVTWLLTGSGEDGVPTEASDRIKPANNFNKAVPIIGRVAAGVFLEVDDQDQSEIEYMAMPEDTRFPNARQIAFIVEGDSMNDLRPRPIHDGDKAVCVSYEDIAHELQLQSGMVVVVERTRDGGHVREWSIKQVEMFKDRTEFHPRSTNPRHKPIIVSLDHDADNGVEVVVLALVRNVVNTIPMF